MTSSNRRVIKSEDVKLLHTPEIIESGKHHESGNAGYSRARHQKASDQDRIKETFAKKLQVAEQKAYEKGLSDGYHKSREFQKNEALQTIQALTSIVTEMSDLKKNILEDAEEQIVQLSLAIAQKVLHLEVTTNRKVVQDVLKAAIKNIVDRENMKIRVNPQDFQYMMEIKSDFLQNFDGIKNIVFEEDVSIQRGGAVIETLFGEVDARLDQQFNEIKTMMTSST
jgi:flagellar assembly protein FliH